MIRVAHRVRAGRFPHLSALTRGLGKGVWPCQREGENPTMTVKADNLEWTFNASARAFTAATTRRAGGRAKAGARWTKPVSGTRISRRGRVVEFTVIQ